MGSPRGEALGGRGDETRARDREVGGSEVAHPRAELRSRPKRFTVDGIEATLVTGDRAGSGFAGTGHAIIYWTIGDTFHQASVHFDDQARVAEMIARGLIAQMAHCDPSAPSGRRICNWVFPGRG
jgi:hypothetical protein